MNRVMYETEMVTEIVIERQMEMEPEVENITVMAIMAEKEGLTQALFSHKMNANI